MSDDAVIRLFDRYESVFNAALNQDPDLDALGELYEEAFIGAAPAGVMTGSKGVEFKQAMTAGFSRSREIGTRSMKVRRVRVERIDDLHALARVDWRAAYETDGGEKLIDFTNVYLTREQDGAAKVFGWITGDEEAELKKHGIT